MARSKFVAINQIKFFSNKTKIKRLCSRRLKRLGFWSFLATKSGMISEVEFLKAKKVLSKALKGQGTFWTRLFTSYPFTKKPIETRMGKGKGAIDKRIYKFQQGAVIFELSYLSFKDINIILNNVNLNLSIKLRLRK